MIPPSKYPSALLASAIVTQIPTPPRQDRAQPDAKSVLDLAPYPDDDECPDAFPRAGLGGEPEVADPVGMSWLVGAFLILSAFFAGGSFGAAVCIMVRP